MGGGRGIFGEWRLFVQTTAERRLLSFGHSNSVLFGHKNQIFFFLFQSPYLPHDHDVKEEDGGGNNDEEDSLAGPAPTVPQHHGVLGQLIVPEFFHYFTLLQCLFEVPEAQLHKSCSCTHHHHH